MFPHIYQKYGSIQFQIRHILVRCGQDHKGTVLITYKPRPSGTEYSYGTLRHLFFPLSHGSEITDQCLRQCSTRLLPHRASHAVKIQLMVVYAATVIVNTFPGFLLQGCKFIILRSKQFRQGHLLQLRIICQDCIQLIHIGLIMLIMVKMQCLLIQYRKQGIIFIGQGLYDKRIIFF